MAAGRRGNNEGTIRQRADGRWEGRVTLADGSQKYYYGKKRADVQKDLVAALKKRQDGLPIMRNEKLTLGEFLKA